MVTTLEGSKKYLQIVHLWQSSTKPANFVKIGPLDVEITALAEIAKIYFK